MNMEMTYHGHSGQHTGGGVRSGDGGDGQVVLEHSLVPRHWIKCWSDRDEDKRSPK